MLTQQIIAEWAIQPVTGNVMDLMPPPDDGGPPTQVGRYWFQVGWMLGPMDDMREEGRAILREQAREITRKKQHLFTCTPDTPGVMDMLRALVDEMREFSEQAMHFRKTFN